MFSRNIMFVFALFMAGSVFSQVKNSQRINQFIDLSGAVGSSQGTVAASYVYNWRLGQKKKFEIGIGGRWTTYFGTKKDFLTAGPAKLTRSFTVPFLIVFAGQNEENFDTLAVQRPLVNMVNATFNLGYHFSSRFYGGINIDMIGFSFGKKGSAILTGSTDGPGDRTEPNAKPTAFNLLLTGDHDKGSLNSEFFIKYKVAKKWSIKALYQFAFVEYKTETVKQTVPSGIYGNRFRNKANNVGLGVSYNL